jgi:serine/threonine protein kinase/ABC-type branched-subunit amino acid transport system substrate-binding protein
MMATTKGDIPKGPGPDELEVIMQTIQSNRFGDYYLTAHLGRGGMADVYRARHVGAAGFQRTVVVKRILNTHNDDEDFVHMFINEAKLAAELTHPNIAQIYELGELDGEFFIAMEYVRGKDLREVLNALARRKIQAPPPVAAFIAREISRGLAHAHGHVDDAGAPRPIIHRDVSPGNIVVSYDGQVKLVDFGIAKALYTSPDATHTNAGLLKGKLGYMAPEQADGVAIPQSDVFAAGVVLYEMLTVRRLFSGENPLDSLTKLKTMPLVPPSQFAPGISPELDAIVMKALSRDLDLRYAGAAHLAKDLDIFLLGERFSVDDLAHFMGELFPVDTQTDPSRYGPLPDPARELAPPPALPAAPRRASRLEPEVEVEIKTSRAPSKRVNIVVLLGLLLSGGIFLLYRYRWASPAASGSTVVDTAAVAPQISAPPEAPMLVRGVTDQEILFGMAAAMSGPGREYGRQMKLGIEAAFKTVNDAGGIQGRRLSLVTVDDSYEPARTVEAMSQLYNQHKVFAFVGNTGTPTAAVALPFALERKTLFFGAFSGASLLRRDPPDRYVFNFRASYVEETAAITKYLIKVRHIRPEQIAVFAQEDPFGDAGFAGVAKAMRSLRPEVKSIFRIGYKRNTLDVNEAVMRLRERAIPVRAVVMLALYRPAAKFIERVRDLHPNMLFVSGSYVDTSALAEELKMLGPRYADGVVVTQVVPAAESSSTAILAYRAALAKYMAAEKPDVISLEGYLVAQILIEGLRRAGAHLDTERLVNTLESIRDLDLGIGAPISFGLVEHQASHKVWGMQLDESGHYQPIDLE